VPRVLTQAQIDTFHRDGLVAPVDCLSPEQVAAHLAVIEDYEAKTGESISRTIRVRAVLALKWLLDVARGPVVAGAMQDLIGPNVVLFLSGVWSKGAGDGRFVSWHQDGAYNPFDRNTGATAWLALTDASEEMGCMHVVPGSHRDPNVTHAETFDPANLLSRGQTAQGVDTSRAVPIPLKAGQISIHHEMVVHGSGPNLSGRRRMGISLNCCAAEAKPLAGIDSAVLIAGENTPGHWRLNRDPAFDFDPAAMAELAAVQRAYRDPEATVLAQTIER
jgi:non-heme Fe2+,alpha-ketoglutarate-dependent halogenase